MIRFPENGELRKLIDILDTNISPPFAVREICDYFKITPAAFLSQHFSLYHAVYRSGETWHLIRV